MRNNKSSYKVSDEDSIEEAITKNEALLRKLQRLEKENKKLKSQTKTLEKTWKMTEEYLANISNGKTLSGIFSEIEAYTNITKINKTCPNCNKNGMNKQQYDGFIIISCKKCNYRNKANEKRSSKIGDN